VAGKRTDDDISFAAAWRLARRGDSHALHTGRRSLRDRRHRRWRWGGRRP
jgi:hypothetical protein